MTVIYLAGKMRGVEDHNFPAFQDATESLRDHGYAVSNPAETLGGVTPENRPGLTRRWFIKKAVKMIPLADAVAVLPSWTDSPGARMEVLIAEELDIPIVKAHDPSVGVEILDVEVDYDEWATDAQSA